MGRGGKVIIVIHCVKLITELILWLSVLYLRLRLWAVLIRFREVRLFKKEVKSSSLPKELRTELMREYSKALSRVYSGLSLSKLIKELSWGRFVGH